MSNDAPKISVVLLTYAVNARLVELTGRAMDSVRGQCQELILVDNGSTEDISGLYTLADQVVSIKKNVGYARGINAGINVAKEDYVVFMSNDTELVSGSLASLCDPKTICFPEVEWGKPDYSHPFWHGGFFCFPRKCNGLHDTDFYIYCSDIDWFHRKRLEGMWLQRVPQVLIHHELWETMDATGARNQWYDKDMQLFKNKWGFSSDGIVF